MSARLPNKHAREVISVLDRDGWQFARVCGSGHVQLRHRETGALLTMSSTPSGRFARVKVLADARRALRARQNGQA